ncbi:MAG: TonB-dependent receptor [Bacteroidia bacterium]
MFSNAQELIFKGKVVTEQNEGIQYAVVTLVDLQRSTFTDSAGYFIIKINNKQKALSFAIKITNVGKATIQTTVSLQEIKNIPIFTMKELSLTLKEVEVNQQRKIQNSNSSILFDRQSIEQAQSFSLTDLLGNLPGKKLLPPDLQNPQNITLRSEAKGIQALSNSLGVAIIIDDIQQSNNANMQGRNTSRWGLSGSRVTSDQRVMDVPFSGIDIRDVPVDNIESIEVISGVAPAKFGDLTDGAIIINRMAGKTPFIFNTRINGSSTNYALSKGYQLGQKWGAINFGFNYLHANEDPSDLTKTYGRVSGNLMWTTYPFKSVKNTISADYSTRLDDIKLDPDDGFEYMAFSKSRTLSLSNRTSITLDHEIAKSISISLGYSSGYQERYAQRYFNTSAEGIADKDTTGIYEGYYIPGNYTSLEHVKGKPLNVNANLSLQNELYTGNLLHKISIGSNIYYSKNAGMGIIVDPTRPRWSNSGYQNDRPYDFESLPDVFNYGVYLQDNFKFTFFNRELSLNAGLRYDVQNAQGTVQPRINASYELSKSINLTAAYGVSTKGPTLAHRYPPPTYIDNVLLNKYTSDIRESIFLVYTDKFTPDNTNLKSSQSSQMELGFSYNKGFISTSIFGYYKDNVNGFSNNTVYRTYKLPQYNYTFVPGGRPIISPNGLYTDRYVNVNSIGNSLNTQNYGLEWSLSTKKIPSIQTSFTFNTSFSYSFYQNNVERVIPTTAANIQAGKTAWFGIYGPELHDDYNLMSKIAITTHIPKLGFVVNLLTDINWQTVSRTHTVSTIPIAYMDRDLNRYEITNFDPANPIYGHLLSSSFAESKTVLPFPYPEMSFRISKEIKEKIRISVNAYNFLNARYRHYNSITNSVTTYSYPTSVGAELSLKF